MEPSPKSRADKQGALPRAIAADVVFRVREHGAYIAAELDQSFLLHPELDRRDVALTTELAYGVIRYGPELERSIAQVASAGVRDPRVLAALLVAVYQLRLLDRVPAFAAVDAAVDEARRRGGARVAGFANAVLRRIAREPKLDRKLARKKCVPAWLWHECERALGPEQTEALFGVDDEPDAPTTCARFRNDRPLPSWAETGEPGRYVEGIRRFRRAGDLRRHAEWQTGGFVLQEEGAALCALALGARPGERILDACAGRGQKASLIAERIAPSGRLWVSDTQRSKLSRLGREFERLGLPEPEFVDDPLDLPRGMDRVLVDAPCTGTGTLRHRPEIALRLTPDDAERLANLAEGIVRRAAQCVKPGGTLLFVVCSVLPRECEELSRRVTGPELVPEPFPPSALGPLCSPGATELRLLPGLHGTDGYYLAHFRRPS